ncbi:PREDICTED: uncharacterized protein LOC109478007 [Branchiostoma belcheri]|uniref:Uncharacterized protein LOC109478007 n=1 Tax=Branchiostoma belcheri TaxID=7741 RepID=A0A6P4ZVP2_BRABE|nr:PREDICTED: uncharacterized protein LOC109478007 [Branchiostoma belcheri]
MAANTKMDEMKQYFHFPRAFEHNRTFITKTNDVTGCHDLRYLLEAQSKGLIVAAVVTDDLPDGVYRVLLTCRLDVDPPTNNPKTIQKRQRRQSRQRGQREAQGQQTVPNDMKTFERSQCTFCDCINRLATDKKLCDQCTKHLRAIKCKRLGLLFKFEPVVKTVYDPAVWPDERLAEYCLRAYDESKSMGRSQPEVSGVIEWEDLVYSNLARISETHTERTERMRW